MHNNLYALEELIQGESGLDQRESIRLADAWKADVLRELQTSGISVIRGLGTFTLAEGQIHFQQDSDFPSLTDIPAVEGFSAQLAEVSDEFVHSDEQSSAPEAAPPVDVDMPDEAQEAMFDKSVEDTVEDSSDNAASDSPTAEPIDLKEVDRDEPLAEDAAWAMGVEQAIQEADRQVGGEQEDITATPAEPSDEAALDSEGSDGPDDSSESEEVELASDERDASEFDSAELAPDTSDENTSDENTDSSEANEADPVPARVSARSRSPRRYERTESSSTKAALWTLGIVVLVVIAALIYRFAVPPAAEDPTFAEQQSDQEMVSSDDSTLGSAAAADSTSLASAGDDPLGADNEDPTTSADDSAVVQSEPSVPAEDNSAGSVTPTIQDEIVRGMGGYTLVVASTLNEQTGRGALSSFESLRLPMGVLAYETDGQMRYRIAVGHYDSAVEADSARIRLAPDLPEGTWVLSVR